MTPITAIEPVVEPSAVEPPAVEPTVDTAAVERALEEIRRHLHGNVDLVGIVGTEVRVRLSGTCADCSLRHLTLQAGVERILRARVPGLGVVVAL